MNTSEVLNKAADLIEERGWTTGGVGMLVSDSLPLCIEGAIATAVGTLPTHASVSRGILGQPVWGIVSVERCPAGMAVTDYLKTKPYLWNDAIARTASEVIEVLRATAVIEAAREDAALLAEVGRA